MSLRSWEDGLPYYRQTDQVRKSQVTACFCPARRNPPQYSSDGDGPLKEAKHGNYVGALGDAMAASHPVRPTSGPHPEADGAMIVGDVLEKQGERDYAARQARSRC